jgi:hypothetical protein
VFGGLGVHNSSSEDVRILSTKRRIARNVALNRYKAGTAAAKTIQDFLLAELEALDEGEAYHYGHVGLSEAYHYDQGGLSGALTPRVDSQGRIVFAVYEETGKSSPKCNSGASRSAPVFLTAPVLWAQLNGHVGQLTPEEYPRWCRSLEDACGLNKQLRYTPPDLLDPDERDRAVRRDDPDAVREWNMKRDLLKERLGKSLRQSTWRLMYNVYDRLLNAFCAQLGRCVPHHEGSGTLDRTRRQRATHLICFPLACCP